MNMTNNSTFWFSELVTNLSLHNIYLGYVGGALIFLKMLRFTFTFIMTLNNALK